MGNARSTDKGYDLISKGVELCLSCGLCCDGTLDDHVALETDETKLVSQLRLTLYKEKVDYDAFDLPCPCFKYSKCSVYAHRPRNCRDYQCKVLKGYLQGTISFGESMELVRKAKSLMGAIYKHIGGVDYSKRIWEQIRNFMELQAKSVNSEEFRRINVWLLVDVQELSITCNYFNGSFFRWRRKQKGLATS